MAITFLSLSLSLLLQTEFFIRILTSKSIRIFQLQFFAHNVVNLSCSGHRVSFNKRHTQQVFKFTLIIQSKIHPTHPNCFFLLGQYLLMMNDTFRYQMD